MGRIIARLLLRKIKNDFITILRQQVVSTELVKFLILSPSVLILFKITSMIISQRLVAHYQYERRQSWMIWELRVFHALFSHCPTHPLYHHWSSDDTDYSSHPTPHFCAAPSVGLPTWNDHSLSLLPVEILSASKSSLKVPFSMKPVLFLPPKTNFPSCILPILFS